MRLALFALMLTAAPPAAARGSDGWGWLIVGAPFALALFVFFDAITNKAKRQHSPYSGLPTLLLSLFLGVSIAILCAEWLAQTADLSKEGGFWLLLSLEVLGLVVYDRLIGFSQNGGAGPKASAPDKK